jgi:UDP-N-acetylmuramyl pentapeptide phosphotransferase/UDP-N-acetylglucosamine-1-phosphate transferase
MENIILVIIGFLVAALMGQVIIPRILVISLRKRLFDIPDERKVHTHPVPRLGGVTFYPTILFVLCIIMAWRIISGHLPNQIFTMEIAGEMLALVAGLTLLYILGIGDDLVGVRYRKKFIVQILSAAFFPLAGLYINNFYGLFGIYALSPFVGIPLTMLLVVFITNAINLIDGIDGLASSICVVALATFGLIFAFDRLWIFSLLAFTCVGVLIPFFIYNVFGNAERGKKIFMGDTGSLTLGYILSFLVIQYCMYQGVKTIPNYSGTINVALSILLVPCLDVIRVVIGRIQRHKSPFLPDKTHIHHRFMAMGFSTRHSLILIQCISLTFIAFTALMVYYFKTNVNIILAFQVIAWTLLNLWFSKVIRKKS